jgi:hypothetical protein
VRDTISRCARCQDARSRTCLLGTGRAAHVLHNTAHRPPRNRSDVHRRQHTRLPAQLARMHLRKHARDARSSRISRGRTMLLPPGWPRNGAP